MGQLKEHLPVSESPMSVQTKLFFAISLRSSPRTWRRQIKFNVVVKITIENHEIRIS